MLKNSLVFDNIYKIPQEELSTLEWIETNGLGGWVSSTVSGMHTRRYHAMLCASINPPVERLIMVSKLAETIISDEGHFELDCNNFNGVIHPQGYQFLEKFEYHFLPEYTYRTGKITLKKTIGMQHGHNIAFVRYEVVACEKPFQLKIKPFISAKNYHWLSKANDNISWSHQFNGGILKIRPYPNMPPLFIGLKNAEFHYAPDWYYNYLYSIELERVQDFKEDLFTYGDMYVTLKKGESITLLLSTEDISKANPETIYKNELARKKEIVEKAPVKDFLGERLALAADSFIVQRGNGLKTIIAGYHWFGDWGRDTMISLPGLCLLTGRLHDAQKILKAFALAVSDGMIPNRFPDFGEVPEYNNADGTLWFFVAAYEYVKAGGSLAFVQQELMPVFKEIIDWHVKGTRYGIKMDADGLLNAGEEGSQLTWMDAKVGDWVVTPRIGKPVEINALWYNALKIMESWSEHDKKQQLHYKNMAKKAIESFQAAFLNADTGALYDYITPHYKDACIRPNQLFAISLPFELVNKKISKSVLKQVEDHLLTPKGLRSLAPIHQAYSSYYTGNQLSRDGAYHQGTVWSWLIGPYLVAKMKVEGAKGIVATQKWLKEFVPHLYEAGIGTVSEIFDATTPYAPKGCMAQAWGVAEILRAHALSNHGEMHQVVQN